LGSRQTSTENGCRAVEPRLFMMLALNRLHAAQSSSLVIFLHTAWASAAGFCYDTTQSSKVTCVLSWEAAGARVSWICGQPPGSASVLICEIWCDAFDAVEFSSAVSAVDRKSHNPCKLPVNTHHILGPHFKPHALGVLDDAWDYCLTQQ
jgi:hypothetical protein